MTLASATTSGGTLNATLINESVFTITNSSFTLASDGLAHVNAANGTIIIEDGATLVVQGSGTTFTNNGVITLNKTGTSATLQVTADELINNGTISGTGTLDFAGTTLTNNGTISVGASPGQIIVIGDLLQSASAVFIAEIAGEEPGVEFDQLSVQGHLTLGGLLDVSLLDGYAPEVGSAFAVITADSISGSFDLVSGLDISDAVVLELLQTDTSVELVPIEVTLSGSSDGDVLIGSTGKDVVVAGEGDDIVHGIAGQDVIFGQAGNDTIFVGPDFSSVDGGTGVDTLQVSGDMDYRTTEGTSIDRVEILSLVDSEVNTVELDAASIKGIVDGHNESSSLNNNLIVFTDPGDTVRLYGEFVKSGSQLIDDGTGTILEYAMYSDGSASILIDDTKAQVEIFAAESDELQPSADASNANEEIPAAVVGSKLLENHDSENAGSNSVDPGSETNALHLGPLLTEGSIDLSGVQNLKGVSTLVLDHTSSTTTSINLDEVAQLVRGNSLDGLLSGDKLKLAFDGNSGEKLLVNGVDVSTGIPEGLTRDDTPQDIFGTGELYVTFRNAENALELYIHKDLVDPL